MKLSLLFFLNSCHQLLLWARPIYTWLKRKKRQHHDKCFTAVSIKRNLQQLSMGQERAPVARCQTLQKDTWNRLHHKWRWVLLRDVVWRLSRLSSERFGNRSNTCRPLEIQRGKIARLILSGEVWKQSSVSTKGKPDLCFDKNDSLIYTL